MYNLIAMTRWNPNILDEFYLDPEIEFLRPNIKFNIMAQCGHMTPLFSEPDVFKDAVNGWFQTWAENFKHLYETTQYDYEPLENYRRYTNGNEESTDNTTENIDETHDLTNDDTTTVSGTNKDVGSGTDTTENTISAMNSSAYQPDNKAETTLGSTMSHVLDNTTQYDATDKDVRDYDRKYERGYKRGYGELTHGNIGVTSSQDMIKQEREIWQFNLVEYIVNKFRDSLMLRVYSFIQ